MALDFSKLRGAKAPAQAPAQTPAPVQQAPATASAGAAPRVGLGAVTPRPLGAQRPVAAPAARAPGSMFGGIEHVDASFGANYVKEGDYYALIRQVKTGETRKGRPMLIIEMTCLGVLAQYVQPPHRVGEEFSHIMMADNDSFLPNVKQFVSAIMNCDPAEVTAEICEEIAGDSQPMANKMIELKAQIIITKGKGQPFTRVTYVREVSATDVGKYISDEQTADRIFGGGVLQAAILQEQG